LTSFFASVIWDSDVDSKSNEEFAMKLKAALIGFPRKEERRIKKILNSRKFAKKAGNVISKALHFEQKMGPAEIYLQQCDTAVSGSKGRGVEFRLTGISKTPQRADADFWKAAAGLSDLYKSHIKKWGKKQNLKGSVQLFVVIMVDSEVTLESGEKSSLVEARPRKISF
tara:strand:- start:316 stop:822 length:507 start_codon:yes stop_codon:yes gene_type:complete